MASSQTYCYAHEPDRSDERRRNASKAAKSKPNREIQALKAQLQSIADRTLAGTLDVRRATAATQALQAKLRAIEVERRIREQEELEARLAAVEEAASARWTRGA